MLPALFRASILIEHGVRLLAQLPRLSHLSGILSILFGVLPCNLHAIHSAYVELDVLLIDAQRRSAHPDTWRNSET